MEELAPIGVFDSGVGGLTVVRALRQVLPSQPIAYLGDTARLPYGSKSPATVLRYTRKSARFLLERGVRLLVIACNTASSVGVLPLRSELPVPVIGVIEPGARAALAALESRRGRRGEAGCIGVIGTLGTVTSGAYPAAIARLAPSVRVAQQACPLLVGLAEEGWTAGDDLVVREVARRYLGELFRRAPDVEVLVLGCTHYPLLAEVIGQVAAELWGREVPLVDSASTVAAEVAALVGGDAAHAAPAGPARPLGDMAGQLRIYVTDPSRFAEVGTRFLGAPLAQVESVDVG